MTGGLTLQRARLLAAAAIVVVIAAVAYILLSGSSYTIHARFADSGDLVAGGSVKVAGRKVGTVDDIGVTPDGQADVKLSIDSSVAPLHEGTRATIRALGQAGVANRYVDLSPGPADAPKLRSGSVLPASQTSGIVNLDAVLDSFGPAQRRSVEQLIAQGAHVYAGSGARYFNDMVSRLDPAMKELAGMWSELGADRAQIAQVIRTGSAAARAIASRRPDLEAAVSNTATALSAIARERAPLADALHRAPAVLDQARTTLADAGSAVDALRPALRDVPAAAPSLRGFVQRVTATLPKATPVVRQLRSELPGLTGSLAGLAPLAPVAVTALRSAGKALDVARPIARAARFYGSDLILGVFAGLAGVATANYDRWGHYARLEFTQPYQTSLGGPLSGLLAKPLLPSLFNLRTHLTRRCPGGNTPPAPDGSSPWNQDSVICDPSEDVPASVNTP